MCTIITTIGCTGFAILDTLIDDGTGLDSKVIHLNKAVTDTTAESLGKQRRKRKPLVIQKSLISVTKDET